MSIRSIEQMLNKPASRSLLPRAREPDALRGFALMGICVVNLPFLGLPLDQMLVQPTSAPDRIAKFVVELLFQGKFFILFAFLFGWGAGVQLDSAQRRGEPMARPYFMRLIGLLVIGLAHALLVFHGDILILYALLGACLWLFRNRSPRQLLAAALASMLAGILVLAALAIAIGAAPPPVMQGAGYLGTFQDAVFQRFSDWRAAVLFIMGFNGPIAFAAFLAGLAAYRTGFLEAGSDTYEVFRRCLPWLVVPALFGNLAYACAASGVLGEGLLAVAGFSLLALGGPSLSALYLAAVVKIVRSSRLSETLAAAGGMSLTAYVAEGVLAGLFFNGYGLGYFGQLGHAALLLAALLIYVLVHCLCSAWLRYQKTGPLERLLRIISRA